MKQDVRRFVKILHDETRSNQYCSFFWHIPAQKPKKVKPSNNKSFINQYQKTPFKVGFADAGL